MSREEKPSETVHLALFKPGAMVHRNGTTDTVDHVVIRSNRLLVRLTHSQELVDSDKLRVELTPMLLQRGPR